MTETEANEDLPLKPIWYLAILRDPYNHLASRLQSTLNRIQVGGHHSFNPFNGYSQDAINCYLELVNQVKQSRRYEIVNYNQWLYDFGYRHTLAGRYGINFRSAEAKRWRIASCGAGSSFTKTDIKNMSGQPLCERYTVFIENTRFIEEVIGNDQIDAIANEYFPDVSARLCESLLSLNLDSIMDSSNG